MANLEAPPLTIPVDGDVLIHDLVERVRAGEIDAFEEILRLYERRVLGLAIQMGIRPADAQDVCQEVFLRVFRYLATYRSAQRFESWLWRISVNVVYDALRKNRNRGEVPWETTAEGRQSGTFRVGGLELSVENADLCAKLLARMVVLTPQERMAFVLRDLQDLETEEVGRAMGISTVTVRRHAAAARQKLRLTLIELAAPTSKDSSER